MKIVVSKRMPHGSVQLVAIKDAAVRDAVMKINENIASLKAEITALQNAVADIQRKKV